MALWAPWSPLREAALYPAPEVEMYRCVLCHFDVVLDDVVISGGPRCICLLCYERICETQIRATKAYLRQLMSAANEVPN